MPENSGFSMFSTNLQRGTRLDHHKTTCLFIYTEVGLVPFAFAQDDKALSVF